MNLKETKGTLQDQSPTSTIFPFKAMQPIYLYSNSIPVSGMSFIIASMIM